MDDLDYARKRVAEFGPAFTLTWVKGVDEQAALRRMGAYPDTLEVREPGTHAAALPLGAWTLVIEPGGRAGGDHVLLEAVSRETEAISLLRDDKATPRFTYARSGRTEVAFDPAYPSPELTWGAEPNLLDHLMHALNLREPDSEDDDSWRDAEAKALVLAQRLTNVRVPAGALDVPRMSAVLEPWFVGGVRPGDLLRLRTPVDASPADKRQTAVSLLHRLAIEMDISDLDLDSDAGGSEPGEAGSVFGPVNPESALGRRAREWLADPLTYGDFTTALRGVLDPDPDVALRAALRPLNPDERAAVLAKLTA
ncbi:DUF6461 domain-containing protein [Actinoplanes sp. TFC3]|uniref:DUF6461 domain-containing protein n=1 Tax=Actinoplanes sp. TFC3 TaxID=1710355 RepID=UPI00128FF6EB|nr:DUF6461 domain-containing protein [Actinoplanes sp. TFC3]